MEREQLRELCPEYALAEHQLNFPGRLLNVMPDGPPLVDAEGPNVEDDNVVFSTAVNSSAQNTEALPAYSEQYPPPPYDSQQQSSVGSS
ncbi:hypothetical protein VKT23_011331 [Stygiomarasmius scandens]|uniref:Uncharacterized protein n=1 Tax=Marasmiellus scandens TaxID=2682957 RepID=A0ABR1JBT8_9AGAR